MIRVPSAARAIPRATPFLWGTVALLAVLAALGTASHAWFVAVVALGVAMAGAVLWRVVALGPITGRRELSTAVVAWGGSLTQTLEIRRQGLLGCVVGVEDGGTLPGHDRGFRAFLPPRRPYRVTTVEPCTSRGRWSVGPVVLHAHDPLGLVETQAEIGARATILVLPRWVPLRRLGLALDGLLPGEQRAQMGPAAPPLVAGIRAWQRGDALSAIDWRATARHGHLMSRQWETGTQPSLLIAVDLDGPVDPEAEELLVTAAASIAMWALHAGLKVALLASGWGAVRVPLARNPTGQARTVLGYLATAHAGRAVGLEALLLAAGRGYREENPMTILLTSRGAGAWAEWLLAARARHQPVAVVAVGEHQREAWEVPNISLELALGESARTDDLIARLELGVRA